MSHPAAGVTVRVQSLVIAFAMAFAFAGSAMAQMSDLIISQYVEGGGGSATNDAIELYNGTGAPINLATGGYKLLRYDNGATTPSATINLSGTVPSRGTRVYVNFACTSSALVAKADERLSEITFTGDDAIVLVKGVGNTVVDSFGDVGDNPIGGWGSGSTDTQGNSLIRKPSLKAGRTATTSTFNPSDQWQADSAGYLNSLGTHLTYHAALVTPFSLASTGTPTADGWSLNKPVGGFSWCSGEGQGDSGTNGTATSSLAGAGAAAWQIWTTNGYGCNDSSEIWATYMLGGVSANGQPVSIQWDHGTVRGGKIVKLEFLNTTDTNTFDGVALQLTYTGGEGKYRVVDANPRQITSGFSYDGGTATLTCTGNGGYTLTWRGATITGTLANSVQGINCVRVMSIGANDESSYAGDEGNVYFNNLVVGCIDVDNDGVCADTDCDDNNAAIYPGAAELCSTAGVDNDCDGNTAEIDANAADKVVYFTDADNDTYTLATGAPFCTGTTNPGYRAVRSTPLDCDDASAAAYPGAAELCATAGTDNDCDSDAAEIDVNASDRVTFYADSDNDTYTLSTGASFCPGTTNAGYRASASASLDCNDANAAVKPGATESCDGVDNNCDGTIDSSSCSSITPAGNGGGSFAGSAASGAIGGSTLNVSFSGTDVVFTITKGAAAFDSSLVLYIDSASGGFAGTSGFTDSADATRRAISGFNGTTRSTVNFASGFTANYALYISPGTNVGAGAYALVNGGSHSLMGAATMSPTNNANAATYTVTVPRSSLGILPGQQFRFVGTYLNPVTAVRSNEGYGEGLPASGNVSGTATFTTWLTATAPCTGTETVSPAWDGTVGTLYGDAEQNAPCGTGTPGRLKVVVDGRPSTNGTWRSAPFDGEVDSMSASFKFSLRNGGGSPGDGFCFFWGDASDMSGTRWRGGEGGLNALQAVGNPGLQVGITTYASSTPGVEAKWGTTVLGSKYQQSFSSIHYGGNYGIDNTCYASDGSRMATVTVNWTRGSGVTVTLQFPGDATPTTILNNVGSATLANIHPENWHFGFAGRNGSIDQHVLIGDCTVGVTRTGATYYVDMDGDTYGAIGSDLNACQSAIPAGYIATGGDCDDANPAIKPGASETCANLGTDNDCDGVNTEAETSDGTPYYADADNDGVSANTTTNFCSAPVSGYLATLSSPADCNDASAATYPGAPELCSTVGTDNDCDSDSTEVDANASDKLTAYRDADGDGASVATTTTTYCSGSLPTGYLATLSNPADCNDGNAAIKPGATDLCDGIDNNCDGTVDPSACTIITPSGNGGSSFAGAAASGAIGGSKLTVSFSGTDAVFTVTKGAGTFDDVLVLYIDSTSGGYADTSGFTDAVDASRKAISGWNGSTRAQVNFASGFTADHALSVSTIYGAGAWTLANGGAHTYESAATMSPSSGSSAAVYTVTVPRSALGLQAGQQFKLVGTYLKPLTAVRSNEGYGAGLPASGNVSGTATFTNWITISVPGTPTCTADWNPICFGPGDDTAPTGFEAGAGVDAMVKLGNDIYMACDTTSWGSTTATRVARWDGSAFYALGTGPAGRVVAMGTYNGKVYVAGAFTSAGGVDANRVAAWDPATSQWSALVDGATGRRGVDGTVYDMVIANDKLFLCGNGDLMLGGVAGRVVYYDFASSTWNEACTATAPSGFSTGPIGDQTHAMCALNGKLYTTGYHFRLQQYDIATQRWTGLMSNANERGRSILALADGRILTGWQPGSSSFFRIYDPATNTVTVPAGAPNNAVLKMSQHLDGRVFVGGDFTTAGGVSMSRFAVWNPTTGAWSSMGTPGFNGEVRSILNDESTGIVWAGGSFTTIGAGNGRRIARFDCPYTPSIGWLKVATQPAGAANAAAFTTQPVVRVVDCAGNGWPVAGITVTAVLSSGGGTLSGTTTATTDAQGYATFTDLQITGASSLKQLRFDSAGIPSATTAQFSLAAGAAAKLLMFTNPNNVTNGTAFTTQPVVRLFDSSNNPVSLAGVTVTASSPTGTRVLGGTLTAITDANGRATFTDLTLTGAAGTAQLSFAASVGGSPLTGVNSSNFSLIASAPVSLAFDTSPPSTATNNAILSRSPVIRLKDQSGNDCGNSGVSVTVSVASGSGTLGGTLTRTTSGGSVTFNDLKFVGLVGARTLSFDASGLTGVTSGSIQVNAGAATQVVLATAPSGSAFSGIAFAQQPVLQAQDISGNPTAASGNLVTVSITAGSGSLAGSSFTSIQLNTNGTASFSGLRITGTGAHTLQFAIAGFSSLTSSVSVCTGINFYTDADGDGYGTGTATMACSSPGANWAANNTDCDDADAARYPTSPELCATVGVDNDCDGDAAEMDANASDRLTGYRDADGDGYSVNTTTTYCTGQLPSGYLATLSSPADCDDTAGTGAAAYPGAVELCSTVGTDNNCDGSASDVDANASDKLTGYRDADGDGYSVNTTTGYCSGSLPSGYRATLSSPVDCNDGSATVNPGATEVCDASNVDENCNGQADDNDSGVTGKTAFYADGDGDGFGAGSATQRCDAVGNEVSNNTDCNDGDAAIKPTATEVCDSGNVDENCNGQADNADNGAASAGKTDFYADNDGDGFGAGTATPRCDAAAGEVTDNTDCDDTDAARNPNTVWYPDADGDGRGVAGGSMTQCARPGATWARAEGDLCPNDPLKTDPGTCGCGTVDADLNGNGVPDCSDNTPPATRLALLTEDANIGSGEKLYVTVAVQNGPVQGVGAQFVVAYDRTKLSLDTNWGSGATFYEIAEGSMLDIPVFAQHDASAGRLIVALGASIGNTDMAIGGALARLRFTCVGDYANAANAVTFTTWNSFTSRIGNAASQAVTVAAPASLVPVTATPGRVAFTAVPAPAAYWADADGTGTAAVTLVAPTALDASSQSLSVTWTRSDGGANLTTFPAGVTTVTWSATDAQGNTSTATTQVNVSADSLMLADVALGGNYSAAAFTRGIAVAARKGSANDTDVATAVMTQTNAGGNFRAECTAALAVAGTTDWSGGCAAVRDPLHTLRRALAVAKTTVAGTRGGRSYNSAYTVDGTDPSDYLLAGNVDGNTVIDILDYGTFVNQRGVLLAVNTHGGSALPHSDLNGNGQVTLGDLTFIQANIFKQDEQCTAVTGETPIRKITVRELRRLGLGDMAAADMNGDGVLDATDLALAMQGADRTEDAGTPDAEQPVSNAQD